MQKAKRTALKQANRFLPSELTSQFVDDLQNVLSQDGSIEGQYLSKFWLTKFCQTDADSAKVRRDAAILKWRTVEERNGTTCRNLMSEEYLRDPSLTDFGMPLRNIIEVARQVVLDVVGTTPSLDVSYAAYSGGASTSRRRSEGHPALKFLGKADSTRRAWAVAQRVLRGTAYDRYLREFGLDPRFVPGSSLFTVPKNSDIDRVACKEPDINVFLQKMFGSQIRTCLKKVGIDLNDQSINGELARIASIDGSLATLDLSAASDSVTEELVRLLLPPDWFYYLNEVRSHRIDIDGETHHLKMFSSMGNGFTFELESLIFYSLARATNRYLGVRGRISVYGDDIITPSAAARCLVSVLRAVGFQVNDEKSFFEGAFRESCGAYWHNGINVKPFFLKGPLLRLTDLIKVLNQLTAWSSRLGGIVDPRYEVIFDKYKRFVPSALHGGQDLTSITSLVTGDAPRKELREVVRERRMSHYGGFLHWLQVTALRTEPGSVQSMGSSNTSVYRVKKNTQWRRDLPIFLGRYASQPESNAG